MSYNLCNSSVHDITVNVWKKYLIFYSKGLILKSEGAVFKWESLSVSENYWNVLQKWNFIYIGCMKPCKNDFYKWVFVCRTIWCNYRVNSRMKKTNRRKTSSPRKVVRTVDFVEAPSPDGSLLAADEEMSNTLSYSDAMPSDPIELAKYIKNNPTVKFFESPQVPAIYHSEVSYVKFNSKPGEEVIYRCQACTKKTFKTAAGLKRHLVRNCPAVLKISFICVLCNEGFGDQSHVVKHINGEICLNMSYFYEVKICTGICQCTAVTDWSIIYKLGISKLDIIRGLILPASCNCNSYFLK